VPEAVGVPEMVMVLADQFAETPAGKPVAAPIPLAPTAVWVIEVSDVLIQSDGVDEAAETVLSGVTVIVPVAFTAPQPPVSGMEYVNVPDAVGVPLMVMVLANHDADTPEGKPVAAPMPVAPVVVCVISVSAVLTQSVGADDAAVTVFSGVTVIVPVALIEPHPPVSGMV